MRARLHTSTSQSTTATLPPQFQNTHVDVPPVTTDQIQLAKADTAPNEFTTSVSVDSQPLVLSKSLLTLLPVLRAQKPHYITAHLHRFPYLLTEGDTLRLPFHMHGVAPGDILRLNRASILGSRDYTLKAGMTRTESYDGNRTGMPQYIDERLFECRARIMGVESTPMMIKEKTKRRNRKVKKVHSKHRYTVLKVIEVRIKSLEELQAEKGTDLILEAEA